MPLLDDVRLALRTTQQLTDAEITDIIEAAKIDLNIAGTEVVDDADKLTKRAIIIYAKANYGMSNPDMEKYQKAYDKLKITLATANRYKS